MYLRMEEESTCTGKFQFLARRGDRYFVFECVPTITCVAHLHCHLCC